MSEKPNFTERGLVVNTDSEVLPSDNQMVLDRLAALVGWVAIGLPLIMILGAALGGGCFRDSISHFYHAQFLGGIFVGLLFFIGAFLFAYSGDHWIETWGSTLAGVGALGVALFPTSGSGCESEPEFRSRIFVSLTQSEDHGGYLITQTNNASQTYFELFGVASDYHMAAAGVVFIYLGLFCLIVLRRIIPNKHGVGSTMIETKRRRNTLYFWSGMTIFLCVAILGLKGKVLDNDLQWWNAWNLTFWIELIALWSFGLAWMAKGRIFKRLND